jgi:hypothetical protein
MLSISLYTLLCVLVCLLIAGALIRQSKTALGLALGLLPIGVMEAIYHLSLQTSIRSCLERACLSAGLPAGCDRIEFGCTEWSRLSVFLFWAAGAAALVLYVIGAIILVVAEGRRPLMVSPWPLPDPGEKARPPD